MRRRVLLSLAVMLASLVPLAAAPASGSESCPATRVHSKVLMPFETDRTTIDLTAQPTPFTIRIQKTDPVFSRTGQGIRVEYRRDGQPGGGGVGGAFELRAHAPSHGGVYTFDVSIANTARQEKIGAYEYEILLLPCHPGPSCTELLCPVFEIIDELT